MVDNPGQRDFRPQSGMTQQPQVPYDPRTGPRTVTPFQTMEDFTSQGKMKDFRPIPRDSVEPDPEPPADVREEILRDPSSALTGMNPVPTEPVDQTPEIETNPSVPSSPSTETSSTSTNPGKNEQLVAEQVLETPMIPTPSFPGKENPSS